MTCDLKDQIAAALNQGDSNNEMRRLFMWASNTHTCTSTLTYCCCLEGAVPCACSGGRSSGSRCRTQPCPPPRLPRHHTWWCSPWSHHLPQETECPVSAFATIGKAQPPLSEKKQRESYSHFPQIHVHSIHRCIQFKLASTQITEATTEKKMAVMVVNKII